MTCESVVVRHIEYVQVTLAAIVRVTGAFSSARDIEASEIGRKGQPVRIRHVFFCRHLRDAPRGIDAIDGIRQLPFERPGLRWLTDPRTQRPRRIRYTACCIRLTLVELAAVRRVREPVTTVG